MPSCEASGPRRRAHRVRGDGLAAADGVDALVGLALHADAIGRRRQRGGEPGAHLVDERRNLRPLEDHGHVEVHDLEAACAAPGARRVAAASMLDAPFQRGSVSGKCRPMSPAQAAPSMASVAAWHTTSASEWPSAPRSDGIVDAAEDQRPALDEPVEIVASADAADRRPRRLPRARRSRSSAVVIFTFAAIAFDDVDRDGPPARRAPLRRSPPRPCGRARRPRPARRAGSACGVCARKTSSRGIVPTITACRPSASTRLTVSLAGTRRSRRRASTAASIVREIRSGGHERPRRVVHEDDVRSASDTIEGVGHRVLPARAARHDAQRWRVTPPSTPADPRRAPAAARRSRRRRDRGWRTPRRCARASIGRRGRAAASARRRRAGGRRRRRR